jgi:hypothetical protein
MGKREIFLKKIVYGRKNNYFNDIGKYKENVL